VYILWLTTTVRCVIHEYNILKARLPIVRTEARWKLDVKVGRTATDKTGKRAVTERCGQTTDGPIDGWTKWQTDKQAA
jgi:hypothetical protein